MWSKRRKKDSSGGKPYAERDVITNINGERKVGKLCTKGSTKQRGAKGGERQLREGYYIQ